MCSFCLFAQDTIPPVVVIAPSSDTAHCQDLNPATDFAIWFNSNAGGMATDNSGSVIWIPTTVIGTNLTLQSALNIFNASQDTLCGNTKNIKIIWKAFDPSGNSSPPYSTTFSVVDTLIPIIIQPISSSMECISTSQDSLIKWIKGIGGARSSDQCSPTVQWTTFNYSTSSGLFGSSVSIANGPYPVVPSNACNWNVSVSFTVVDECGNQNQTSIRKFELNDSKAPVFSSQPQDITVQCSDIPSNPNITAVDACTGLLPVLFTETKNQNADTSKCDHYNYTITRKWDAKDGCNNTVTYTQKIKVIDDKGPELSGPLNKTIDCTKSALIDSLLTSKKDRCSPSIISYVDSLISGSGCSILFKRKYNAKDVCFNTTLFNQLVTVVDKTPPFIITPAKNSGIDCNATGDVNLAFTAWMNSRAQSVVSDQCNNGLKSFVAKPGTYNLLDSLTFPGVFPNTLDTANCDLQPKGYSRGEIVDFVFYDNCGNASVTKAYFGVTDTNAPIIDNCQNNITKEVETADCSANVNLTISSAQDDCTAFSSPIGRFATSPIISTSPGDNEVLVNPITIQFGPYNPNTFTINGSGTLNIDLIRTDADDTSEYFRIIDEDGNFLGKTSPTTGQCLDGKTTLSIPASKLSSWVSDGTIKISFVPNVAAVPVLSINDICPAKSRLNADLFFPINANNTIRTFYTELNSKDTIETTGLSTYSKKFPTGTYDVKFLYQDCAKNVSSCNIKIAVKDAIAPQLTCPKDTVLNLSQNNCLQDYSLNLNFSVLDNCDFPEFYNQVAPISVEAQKINFKFVENSGVHLATNKVIVFNNVSPIKYANTDAELTVNVSGDFNNPKEYFSLVGEGGYEIGQSETRDGSVCISTSKTFLIPQNIFNQWASDEKVEITAVANNDASEEGMGINPCKPLTSNQTLDDESKIAISLKTRQPIIQYNLDNNGIQTIPSDKNQLDLKLSTGNHKITFSTIDKAGNVGICISNIEIKDNVPPIAKCKNFIAEIHPSGLIDFVVKADSINNGSSDNCAIDSLWVLNNIFNCSDIGSEKIVTLFVSDKYKNIHQCESKIKIQATVIKPMFSTGLCDGDTLKLFANIPPPVDNNVFTVEWYKDNVLVANTMNPIFPGTSSSFNGLYKVVVKGFNNCIAEGIMTINIKPLSTPLISVSKDSYCELEEVNLKTDNFSGNVKYEWYEGFPPSGILIGTTNTPEFLLKAPIGIHNYYVIGRSPECVSNPSLTQRIFIYKKPEVNLLSFFQNVCEGDDIKLGTTTSGQNFEYSWTGPDGFMSKLQNPETIKNAQIKDQGKYLLVVNVKDCISDTVSTNIVVISKPGIPIITGESIYCENSTFSLVVNNIPAQEKYTWIKDGERFKVTQDNSLEIINVPTSISGKWTVVVESNGCKSDTSEVKNIDIDNLSLVGASNNGPVCEGDTIELNATFVPNAIYNWKGLDFVATGQSVKTVAKPGEYFVTITTTTGCDNVASTTVEVNQLPIITALSNNSMQCTDGKTDIVFFPSVIPQGNFEYEWTGPNFTSNIANARIPNATELNNGKYVLKVLNKKCPSIPDTSEVNVQLIPAKADFAIPSSICEGDTLILISNTVADTFYWNTPKGIIKSNSGKLIIPNIQKSNQGNYHLIIKKENCFSTDFNVGFLEVKDKPLPVAIVGKNELCFGESIILSTNNTAVSSASWILPNGSIIEAINLPLNNVTELNKGAYKVVASFNGCKAEASKPFEINVKPQIAAPILKQSQYNICSNENQPIELCIVPKETGLSYFWANADDQLQIETTTGDCIVLKSNDLDIGNNFINVKALKNGCQSLASEPIQILKSNAPNIKAEANVNEIAACTKSDLVQLSSVQKEPTVDITWKAITPGMSILSPDEALTVVKDFTIGLNLVVLSYSKDGCKNFSTDTVEIYLNELPKLNDDIINVAFNENKTFNIFLNDTIGELYSIEIEEPDNGNFNGDNGQYTFEPSTGFAGTQQLNYKICIRDCPNLCSVANIILKVGSGIKCEVPNVITPNNDGINDEFIIPCLEVAEYGQNELIIFNQWGDEVYTAKPYRNNWKGTYGDDPLPVGTYFYIFNLGNGDSRLNGFFIIQR
jgi:gliding motility-associated-like protein